MPSTRPPLLPRHGQGPGRLEPKMAVTEQQILDALSQVRDPEKGGDIVSLGMVSGMVVRDGNVGFAIEVEPERGPRLEPLRKAAEQAVEAVSGGLSVGVLDADIYGPSMPRMLGISGRPSSADGKMLRPMQNYGLKRMSIGFLVPEDTPMIWRGPMVMSALQQMLREVEWGELDIMIADMPPGTGDAQLTMAQQVPLAGAVIVSTPQDIALLDARKGLNMFKQVDVPVLGIVENMSYFLCPHCGGRSEIFSHGGARREAARLGTEFLGERSEEHTSELQSHGTISY